MKKFLIVVGLVLASIATPSIANASVSHDVHTIPASSYVTGPPNTILIAISCSPKKVHETIDVQVVNSTGQTITVFDNNKVVDSEVVTPGSDFDYPDVVSDNGKHTIVIEFNGIYRYGTTVNWSC